MYQCNLPFRLRGIFEGNPKVWLCFRFLVAQQLYRLVCVFFFFFFFFFSFLSTKANKPNQTKLNWTNQTKLNQTKQKNIYFVHLSKPSIQTKPNWTFSTINFKLTASNKIRSKVPEKFTRAAQLLYRPVLVGRLLGYSGVQWRQSTQFVTEIRQRRDYNYFII